MFRCRLPPGSDELLLAYLRGRAVPVALDQPARVVRLSPLLQRRPQRPDVYHEVPEASSADRLCPAIDWVGSLAKREDWPFHLLAYCRLGLGCIKD